MGKTIFSKLINNLHFTAILLGFLTLSSCKEKACEVKVPEISFESFFVTEENEGILTINFNDCDGDVGLNDNDTISPYNIEGENYYNLDLIYHEKQNGIWVRFDSLTPPFSYRIPVLNKDGSNTTLDGQIIVTLEPIYYVPIGNFDTIKFEIKLKDRALNISNIIETNEIFKP